MPHSHAYGRLAKMPGVTSTFTFRPAELSPRIRNSAKKMVQERLLRGSWGSQSHLVARVMLNHARVPFATVASKSVHVVHAGPELRKELEGFVIADRIAGRLHPSMSGRENWADYQERENLDRLRANFLQKFFLYFHDNVFRDRAAQAVADYHLREDPMKYELAQRACALLDDPNALIEVMPEFANY